jgi:magnesium chelatase family protein
MATQPCPCGNFGNPNQACNCHPAQIQRYVGKISGPLLDRIDIHVEVPAVRYGELATKRAGESFGSIRARVVAARAAQAKRFSGHPGLFVMPI